VLHHLRDVALAFEQRTGNGVPAPGRVAVEIKSGNAGAVFGKSQAFDLVEGDPFAVRALTASISFRQIIF
jgi:hypothetical protein